MGKRIALPAALGIIAALALAVTGCGGGGGGDNGGTEEGVRGGIAFFPLVQSKQLTYQGGPNNPGDVIVRTVTERTTKNGQTAYVMIETINGVPTTETFWTIVNPATVYLVGERDVAGAGPDVYYNPTPAGPGAWFVMTPANGSWPSNNQPIVDATSGITYSVSTTTVGGLTLNVPAGIFHDVMRVRQVWTSPGGTQVRLYWLVANDVLDVGIIQTGHEEPAGGAEIIDSKLFSVSAS